MSDVTKQKVIYIIDSLSGEENYELWSIRMKSVLAKDELVKHIQEEDYEYTSVTEGFEKTIPTSQAEKAMTLLKLSLLDDPLLQIHHLSKPYTVWKTLERLYSSKDFSSEFLLCKELFNTTLDSSEKKIKMYLNTVKRLNDQLKTKDIDIPEKVIFA